MRELFSAKNNSVTTIQNCADEPIHIPGSIQPHGFILIIDEENLIALASANAGDFLGLNVNDILSRPFSDVLPSSLAEIINYYINSGKGKTTVPAALEINQHFLNCFFRPSSPFIVLECVAAIEHPNTVYDVLQHTDELVQAVNARINLHYMEIGRASCRERV